MVVLEAGSPVGSAEQSLDSTSEVDEAVTHEEEHGEKWGQVVDIPKQDSALADAQSQNKSSSGLSAARRHSERCQQRNGAVLSYGL